MNAKRLARLTEIRDTLNELQSDLVTMYDQEQDYLDNMPKAFHDSAKGEGVQAIVNHLENAVTGIDETVEAIEEIQGV